MTTNAVQHPGELLWTEWLDPMQITITEAAKALGVSRKTVSAIIGGRQGISPEMSVRLGLLLNVPAEAWLRKQTEFDVAHVDRRRIRVKCLRTDTVGVLDVD